MKILLTNHFPLEGSGSGVYVENIAKNLVKQGHDVCIIMPENTTKIKKTPGIKVHPVYFKRHKKIDGQLNFNFPCFDPHPRSNMNFLDMTEEQVGQYIDSFKAAIEQEIEEFKPDVIHAQHIWIISSIAVGYNIPVVITCHGSDIMGYNESARFHEYAYKAVEGVTKIIAISHNNKRDIIDIFKNQGHKVELMPNGYDPNVFYKENIDKKEILKEFGIDKEFEKVVCFAGRLAKNKGIDILLKSAKLYEKDNILTLIAGHGQEYENLYPLKESLNLKNVYFLGDQNQENLRKIYNISDVLVVPSREEAFGLVALEGIACGVPVVATRVGGIPDIITSEVGILVEKENVEELTQEINNILNEKIKFNSEYLQMYAKEKYTQESLMNKLLDIYKEIE